MPSTLQSRCRIDQLDSDADLVGGLTHAALQHVLDAQLLSYLSLFSRFSLVGEAGIARDHKEAGKPREVIDQLVADTIAEVVLLRVAAQICERQYRDRWSARQGSAGFSCGGIEAEVRGGLSDTFGRSQSLHS